MGVPRRVFIIYAHEDDDYRIKLRKTLRQLERRKGVEVWDDREIVPGTDWGQEIDTRLEQVDIFIPLLSFDFFLGIKQTINPLRSS